MIAMLRQPEGATVDEVASVTGWHRHTVRGVFSGTLKKKLGLTLASATEERGRVLPHRRAGERMMRRTQDATARQHSGELSPVPGRGGNRTSRPASEHVAEIDGQIAELFNARRRSCGLHGANCIAPARRRGSVAIC